jgi:hypothetical protein
MKPEQQHDTREGDPLDPAAGRDPAYYRPERDRFAAGEVGQHEQSSSAAPAGGPQGFAPGDDPEMRGSPQRVPTADQRVTPDQNLFTRDPWVPAHQPEGASESDDEATPRRVSHPARLLLNRWVSGLALLATAVIGLILVNQVAAFIERLNAAPMLLRWAGYGLLGVLLLAALYSLVRLLWLFARLRVTPQLEVPGLAELHQSAALTGDQRTRLRHTRRRLNRFIREYPLDRKTDQRRLMRLGMNQEEIEQLRTARTRLLADRGGADHEWVHAADDQFVQLLDAVAQRRRRRYATLVGIKAAAVPTGFLDALVALINAYLLVGDLCRLYNLRASLAGTGVILAWVFVQTYTAAQVEDWGELAADSLTDHASQSVDVLSKQLGGRAVEFGVNAIMVYRLGGMTMRRVRPVKQR